MKQSQSAPEARAGPAKTKPAAPRRRVPVSNANRGLFEAGRESGSKPLEAGAQILGIIARQCNRKYEMQFQDTGRQGLRIEANEADFYAREAAKESELFAATAAGACGRGPWKKIGDWLYRRNRSADSVTRALGIEVTLIALMLQALADRMGIYQPVASPKERQHLDTCVYLMVRALRCIAPDAVRKAMRNDA